MQQKGNVVVFDDQVALVDICGKWKRVQLRGVQLRPLRVVHDLAVLAIADAEDFAERLAVRVLDNGMVEFAACDKIDVLATIESFVWLYVPVRTDECDL